MKSLRCFHLLQALLLLGLPSEDARADGGVVRFREANGPFIVTIFTPPELGRDIPLDVSVMVQRRDTRDPVLDAAVDLVFTPPPVSAVRRSGELCGLPGVVPSGQASGESRAHLSIPATRAQASNKLLYAAPVRFDTPGQWKLEAVVRRERDSAEISCGLLVVPASSRLMPLLPYLALPPLLAVLFAVNQCLRKPSPARDRGTEGPSNLRVEQVFAKRPID